MNRITTDTAFDVNALQPPPQETPEALLNDYMGALEDLRVQEAAVADARMALIASLGGVPEGKTLETHQVGTAKVVLKRIVTLGLSEDATPEALQALWNRFGPDGPVKRKVSPPREEEVSYSVNARGFNSLIEEGAQFDTDLFTRKVADKTTVEVKF